MKNTRRNKMTQENKQSEQDPITVAGKIWAEIKDKSVEMFSLPAKPLREYAKMVPIEPSKLYLSYTIPALLPALEPVLGTKYKIDLVDKYLVISLA